MKTIISESQVRKEICEVGQKLYDKGFVAANDGNISVRLNENHIIVTPTGVSKGGMTPESLVKMDLEGNIIGGKGRPSSEVKMHIQAYKIDPLINAVVHAHPPLATAFAVARIPLERPILAEAVVNLGIVPVADFALPGSQGVPDSIKPYIKDYNAVLLANHGLITWGENLEQAFFRHESVEHYCKILYYVNQIGSPKEFNCTEISELINIRKKMGIHSGGVPQCDTNLKQNVEVDEQEELVRRITKKVLEQLR